jgi:rubrerythrin
MALAKTFYLLKDAETRTGELYAMIGLSVSVTRPDLAELFADLAEEEHVHAKQVELMRAIFLQCQDAFLEAPEAEKAISEFVENLGMLRTYFNQHHAQLQPADLLNLALDIERNLVESHQTFFFQVSDAQVKKLFASLNQGNSAHIRRLETFPPG